MNLFLVSEACPTGSGSGTVQHPYKGPTGQGGVRMQCILMLELVSVVVLY